MHYVELCWLVNELYIFAGVQASSKAIIMDFIVSTLWHIEACCHINRVSLEQYRMQSDQPVLD